jgi:hypothetical protein
VFESGPGNTTRLSRLSRLESKGIGLLLLAPMLFVMLGVFVLTRTCEMDCGDRGGKTLFLLMLVSAPLALIGIVVLIRSILKSTERGKQT